MPIDILQVGPLLWGSISFAGTTEGSQGHWHASDPSRDHRRSEETRFSDCPGKAERFGGLEVDGQLEFGRLLDRS
jgi:hypothetical protein